MLNYSAHNLQINEKKKLFHYIINFYNVVILSKIHQEPLQNREQGSNQVHQK